MLELSPFMALDVYLELEQTLTTRHEYVGGYRYAVQAESSRHNRVALNIATHLLNLAESRPCRVYQTGTKLRAGESLFYYPDVMVVCDKPEPDSYFELEPCILVEVLSPGTKYTDLREKLTAYKSLPSVQTYLIVEAERLAVRHIAKRADGTWLQEDLTGDGDIPLPCLGGVLSLPQIYRNVF